MKRFLICALALFIVTPLFALSSQDQQIFNAMQDEMTRTQKELKMPHMAKPYFTVYKVINIKSYDFLASSGTLAKQEEENQTVAKVMIRVGTPKDDNSFFKESVIATAPVPDAGDNYYSLRYALWGLTDSAYKQALAQLAKKDAFKKNKNITEVYDDFSKAAAAQDIKEISEKTVDKAYWADMAKQLSAQGKGKNLDEFNAEITIYLKPSYFLSQEGAKYLKDDYSVTVSFEGKGKTADGFPIREGKSLSYFNFKDVPPVKELAKQASEIADRAQQMTKAQKAEPFIGPVLLEKDAAAALFNKTFKENIIRVKQVRSSDDNNDNSMGEFAQKIGLKIMPVDFDVLDDPTIETFNGRTLGGYYTVDDEGVGAEKLLLVKNGKLVNLPTTRSLIKDEKVSNGHARAALTDQSLFVQTFISNLIFLPHKTVEEKNLKTKLMSYCREEGLDYCYIIKSNPAADVFTAYKVDSKSGAETPVYGIDKINFTTRSLRDIKFAGDDLEVYGSANINNPSYSIVAPSVILSEIELKPTQKTGLSKPLVPRP